MTGKNGTMAEAKKSWTAPELRKVDIEKITAMPDTYGSNKETTTIGTRNYS